MTTLIAVDSGGTRTSIAVQEKGDDGPTYTRQLDLVLDGTLDPDHYPGVLREILSSLEPHWADRDLAEEPAVVYISAAGFAAPTRLDFHDSLGEVLPHVLGGSLKSAGAGNDAVSLLLGYDADGVVIAGTGSNVVVRGSDGAAHQVGGDDWVAGDFGSGFWIGLRAIRQASKDLEAGVDSNVLTAFREVYGINRRRNFDESITAKFIELAVADADMKAEIARFAARICQAASDRIVEAQDLVKEEAEDLADSTARALQRRFTSDHLATGLVLVQSGSLLFNDFYRSAYESHLQLRLGSLGPDAAPINWINTRTGIDSALRLARRLATNGDLTRGNDGLPVGLRPVVAHYG